MTGFNTMMLKICCRPLLHASSPTPRQMPHYRTKTDRQQLHASAPAPRLTSRHKTKKDRQRRWHGKGSAGFSGSKDWACGDLTTSDCYRRACTESIQREESISRREAWHSLQSRLGVTIATYAQVPYPIRVYVLHRVGHGVWPPSTPVHVHEVARTVSIALLPHKG